MLLQHRRAFATVLLTLDVVTLAAAIQARTWSALGDLPPLPQIALELACTALAWNVLAQAFRLYQSRRTGRWLQELSSLVLCGVFTAGAVLMVRAALTGSVDCEIGRALVLALLTLEIARLSIRMTLRALRRRGLNTRTFLFVGRGKSARALAEQFQQHDSFGIRVLGGLAFTGEENLPTIAGVRSLGSPAELQEILRQHAIDELVICPSDGVWTAEVKSLLRFCETVGLTCRVTPDFLGIPLARATPTWLGEVPSYEISSGFQNSRMLALKRVVDVLCAAIGLVVLLPLLVVLGIAVRATSRGPMLFRQTRVGLNGHLFTMYKFRSMVADAEQQREALARSNELRGPVFKMRDDPRITRLGRFLRRYSLDELPQLFNVLIGDMSLVGPRPPLPAEVLQYDWWQRRRLSVRPGLTCIWQVSGRQAIDFDRWMELDLQYIDGWTIGMDMKILAKTVREVLRGQGV